MAVLDLIGSSEKFQDVLDEVRVVAQAECSVLLHGETGTGKEVIAARNSRLQPASERTLRGAQLRGDSGPLT